MNIAMTTIQNKYFRLAIHQKGAELGSIFNIQNNTEYLWQAAPEHWARHAPVLFPIVGKLKNNQYLYENQAYNLGQHGFARDMNFQIVEQTDTTALFLLENTPETAAFYPFAFQLYIRYTLAERKILVEYQVKNPATEKPLYFSIGAHPAFRCPLHDGENRSDYQLVFNKKETAATQYLADGLRTGDAAIVLNNSQNIPLTDDLFDKDALVFKNIRSTAVTLQKGETPIFTFHFEDFPYMGIWSKSSKSPFVCIEPWFGVADHLEHSQQLTKKEGIINLAAGQSFSCAYAIEFEAEFGI